MNIEVTAISIFDILSISTAFMLGLLFITCKSRNNKANIFLGLFLWSLTSEVFSSFLNDQLINFRTIDTGALTLPFFFLYVIKTLNYRIQAWYIILVIPFLVEFIENIPYVFHIAFSIFLLFYILRLLRKHQVRLGEFYSDTENKTLSWIKNIVYIYLFFYSFWAIEDIIGLQYKFVIEYFAIISTILTLLMIYFVGYNGFTQSEIFNNAIITTKEKKPTQPKLKEDINANEIGTIEIFQQLIHKIRIEKLFLQKNITLRDLSRQLDMNEKELSKLINIHTKKNFYHFINQFRLEEFKHLLETDKSNQMTLLGLSEEAGFHSKSTFYSVFKTSEGITPKQYLNQLNKSE